MTWSSPKGRSTTQRGTAGRHERPASSITRTSYTFDSGVVYDEVEVAGIRGSRSWISDYKTPNLVRRRPQPNDAVGARSLSAMALNKVGIESQNLTVEVLQSLPWAVGERIWDHVCETHTESFYIWRTFACAYGNDFASKQNRYMLDIRSVAQPVVEYYRGIASKEFQWLICLRVSPKQVTVPDLVSISSISNLSVLDLSDGQLYIENRESTFDQRVMRSWAEMARSGRAFGQLRVLLLGWQEKVDDSIFEWLTAFPRLNMLVLTDCRWLHHKNHKDWEELAWSHDWDFLPTKRGVKHLRSLLDDRSFYVGNVSNMHYESVQLSNADGVSASPVAKRALLECWLGTPRIWNHVIDEFPGTRTVILQKLSNAKGIAEKQPVATSEVVNKRQPSSPVSAGNVKRVQGGPPRRRPVMRSSASLLSEMAPAHVAR